MRWWIILLLVLAACTSEPELYDVLKDEPIPMEEPLPMPEEQEVVLEVPEVDEPEAAKAIPDDAPIEPLICKIIQNMSSPHPERMGENIALAISVGTDSTKMGVYDLGYMLPSGLFRIGRQGLKITTPMSIKIRGPSSAVTAQPMEFSWTCDNRTFTTNLPVMTRDTIFYVDTYGRLYWRDDDHDGTGQTMDWERALMKEHRYS
jgi:hypothetical protein